MNYVIFAGNFGRIFGIDTTLTCQADLDKRPLQLNVQIGWFGNWRCTQDGNFLSYIRFNLKLWPIQVRGQKSDNRVFLAESAYNGTWPMIFCIGKIIGQQRYFSCNSGNGQLRYIQRCIGKHSTISVSDKAAN